MKAFSTSFLRFSLLALFAVFTVLASSLSGNVAVAADKQLNGLEMKARESFAAGRYDEALQTFAKLYAETLHPVYLRNIGRCHQKMREPQKAIDAFQDYLAKTKTGKDKITPDERTEIEGYIKDMETLRDAQAAKPVEPVGGTPVTPLNNPNGTTTASPILAQPAPQPQPAGGPTSPVVLTTAPASQGEPSHPFYTRWWFWTGVGAVVVGGVVAAVVLSGGSTRDACPAGVVACK